MGQMKNPLIAIAMLLIGIALSEIVFRIAFSTTSFLNRIVHSLGPDGERVGWLYLRRSRGPDRIFTEDADIGWVAHAGIWQGDGWSANVLDGGLRAPGPSTKERVPGKVRIVALGDSFGFGWDQSDDRTWQAALLRLQPSLEIVNLSVCGHDTGQALLRYRRDGRAWNPDYVLLAYNDLLIRRTIEPFTMYQRPIIMAERGDFNPIGVPIPDQETMETQLLWKPHTLMALGMLGYHFTGRTKSRMNLAEERSQAILDRFIEEVKKDGRIPIVAWFSPPHEALASLNGKATRIRCPGDGSVTCMDLTGALETVLEAGKPIEKGTHWSDPVAEEVAKLLDKKFREMGIVSAFNKGD
jgi:hypothetical protein